MMRILKKSFWPVFTAMVAMTIYVNVIMAQSNTWPDFRGNMLGVPSGFITSSGKLTGDLDLNSYDIYNQAAKTTDAAPDASQVACGQSAYWGATAGTNATGGACYLSGGIGNRAVSIANNTLAGDTLVIAGIHNGAATSATWTWNAAGPAVGADVNASAVALVAYCNTNGPALGIASCACSDATCTGATPKVGFIPDTDTVSLTLTASDASQTVTSGADGRTQIVNAGTAAAPGLAVGASGYGLYGGWSGFGLAFNGAAAFYCDGNWCYIDRSGYGLTNTGGYQAASASWFKWSGRSVLTSPADGKVTITNNAGTSGYMLDGTTDSQLVLSGRTNTGDIRFNTASTVKGQTLLVTSAVANCTFAGGGGGATCVTGAFIPLGTSVIQISGRQVTANGTCTTCTAGADMGSGLDADQYGSALECDVNDTLYTTATATANVMGTCLLAGGCTITMTAVGGNCVSGVAAWTVHYLSATAATSD